jgi:hypothetical protein
MGFARKAHERQSPWYHELRKKKGDLSRQLRNGGVLLRRDAKEINPDWECGCGGKRWAWATMQKKKTVKVPRGKASDDWKALK